VGANPDEAATLAEVAITGAQKKATEQAKLDPAALIAKRRGMSDDSFEARGIDRALLDTGKYNNLFIDPNDPNLAFAGANGVQISMYDKDTGGLVDAKNYSADTFGGGAQGAADYARFKAQHKTISDKAAIDGARAMAAQGKKDKTTRDLAVDKLAKGAAMSVKAGGASVRDQELYRDIESKQKGKKASEWNHDFVEHSQDSFVKGMSAQDITEAFSKGNPKVREALEKRLKEAKTVVGVAAGGGPAALDPNGNPITDISGAKMAELEAAYTAATGRVL
jgi:hypothetical protein